MLTDHRIFQKVTVGWVGGGCSRGAEFIWGVLHSLNAGSLMARCAERGARLLGLMRASSMKSRRYGLWVWESGGGISAKSYFRIETVDNRRCQSPNDS